MPLDYRLINGLKTTQDFQREDEQYGLDTEIKKAQIQRLLEGGFGGDPSAVREWKYFQGLDRNKQKDYLEMKRSSPVIDLGDKKVVRNPLGGITEIYPISPSPEQMPDFKGAQAGAAENAKLQEQLKLEPEIDRRKKQAEAETKKYFSEKEDLKKLSGIRNNIKSYLDAAAETNYTGPVLGRIGSLVEAPGRTNLVSAGNELAFRAKDLLNFPSNNFSNSDLTFLKDISAGTYARAEGINKVAKRMDALVQQQMDYILNNNKNDKSQQQDSSDSPPLSEQRRLRWNAETGALE